MGKTQFSDFEQLHFLDAVLDAVAVVTASGEILQVNKSLENVFGYTALELLGQNIKILTSVRFADVEWSNAVNMLRNGANAHYKVGEIFGFCHKDGTELPLEAMVSQLHSDKFSANSLYLAAFSDVTLLNQIQGELRHALDDYYSLLNGVADLIQSVNSDGSIAFVNRSWLDTLGYSNEEISSMSIFEIIAPEQHEHCQAVLAELMAGEKVGTIESRFISKNGTLIDVEGRIALRKDRFDRTTTIGLFRDITERKLAESRLKEFYSIVSHELRAPLTSINGSVKLIESGVLGAVPEQIAEFITIASQETDRLLNMINDMLDLRKIEMGKFVLVYQKFAVHELVTTVLNVMSGMAAQAKVQLKSEVDEKLFVSADRSRIFQTLVNLISNAIKHSPSFSTVLVRVCNLEPGLVRFSVIDRGRGIAKGRVSELFTKFQQLESESKQNFPGTGLGLAISKAIVEEHGGSIGVESHEGEGSTFWFELSTGKQDTIES